MVGSAARMRASLVTAPFCTGTFKSSLIRTRLPRRSVSVIRNTFILSYSGLRLRPGHSGVEHAIREAPLVVVPRAHLHERAFDHLGERGVERRGMRIVVEVDRHERAVTVREDALPRRRAGGLLHECVHIGHRGGTL